MRENIKERVKENIKERVKENIKDRVKEHVKENIKERVIEHVRRQWDNSPQHRKINDILENAKYLVIKRLIKHMEINYPDINVPEIIINKTVAHFLMQNSHGLGEYFITQINDCLDDFYRDCNLSPSQSEKYSATSAQISTAPQARMPTLADLNAATTADKQLQILEAFYGHATGWYLGHLLAKDKSWTSLRRYLDILMTLDINIVEQQFNTRYSSNTFIELITTQDVPADVIFTLLNNFTINPENIKKIARLSGLKEAVKSHIEGLSFSSFEEELNLWYKCVTQDTPLGKFFMQPRTSFGLSKFKTDYANTNIVESIQCLIMTLEKRRVIFETLDETSSENSLTPQAVPDSPTSRISFFTAAADDHHSPTQAASNTNLAARTNSLHPLSTLILAGAGLGALLLILYSAGLSGESYQEQVYKAFSR